LARPLICPPRTTLRRSERPGTDSDGTSVAYISENCAGDDNVNQPAEARIFVGLRSIYFVVFSIAALDVSFVIGRTAGGGPLSRPLGLEGQSQVEAVLDQKRKIDAIRLVQRHTGANLRQAKDYVGTLAPPRPGRRLNLRAARPNLERFPVGCMAGAANPLQGRSIESPYHGVNTSGNRSNPDATAELARLKAQLQSGQITAEEFKGRAAEIALRR
jgi:hypothetical protein